MLKIVVSIYSIVFLKNNINIICDFCKLSNE